MAEGGPRAWSVWQTAAQDARADLELMLDHGQEPQALLLLTSPCRYRHDTAPSGAGTARRRRREEPCLRYRRPRRYWHGACSGTKPANARSLRRWRRPPSAPTRGCARGWLA